MPTTDRVSAPTTERVPAEVGGCDLTGIDLSDRDLAGAEPSGVDLTADLLACRDAEDYFRVLDVPFDPHLLHVNRLHILRLFGPALRAYLADGGDRGSGSPAALRLGAALADAHDVFTSSSALDHRLFKVLQDRAPRSTRTFVPLDGLEVESPAHTSGEEPVATTVATTEATSVEVTK